MTTRQLSFKGPLSLDIIAGASVPDPGIVGVQVWSTLENATVFWNGTAWALFSSGGGGGGSTIYSGVAVLDFGIGSNETEVVITGLTTIAANSKIMLTIQMDDSTISHTQNDHRYFSALCGLSYYALTPGTGFTICGTSIHKLTGQFKVRYTWS